MNKSNKSNLPCGIRKTNTGRYSAMYNTKSLGVYNSIEEAMSLYNAEKQIHIRNVADEYRSKIPPKLYDALYNWIPDDIIRHKNITEDEEDIVSNNHFMI